MEVVEELLVNGLKIIQDTEEYRFTSDSVLLARFLKAKKGERVADFCSGSGIVGLHFFAENRGIEHVTLFELNGTLAKMSEKTVALNGLEEKFTVENVAIQEIPAYYTERFSLILCNPPYGEGGYPACKFREARGGQSLSLDELCGAAQRCLKFGGRFTLIHRADRLTDLLVLLRSHRLEPKKLRFVAGGGKPYAVLVAAVKGGKPGLEVLHTLVNQKEES